MPNLPLYFDLTVRVSGPAFGAEVRIQGRGTCVAEDDPISMYGVNPGALVAGGSDVGSAYEAFRRALGEVLCDLAEMEGEFERFREAAQAFVAASNRISLAEWEAARQAVRAGSAPDVDLRRETGEIEPAVEIREVSESPKVSSAQSFTPAFPEPLGHTHPQSLAA